MPEQTTIHEFTLEPPNIGPPTQGVPGQSWYFHQFGKSQGPVDFARLQQMADAGQLVGEDLVWKEGMPEWIHAARVPGLIRPADSMSAKQPMRHRIPYAHLLMEPPRVSGLAVASLVLGILWLAGIGSLLAIIFGGVAMHQIRNSHGRITGTGLAVAGLTLGIVFGSLQVIAIVMTQTEMGQLISMDSTDKLGKPLRRHAWPLSQTRFRSPGHGEILSSDGAFAEEGTPE